MPITPSNATAVCVVAASVASLASSFHGAATATMAPQTATSVGEGGKELLVQQALPRGKRLVLPTTPRL